MEKTDKKIKSGDYCKCGYCGYQGYCYGTPFSNGSNHKAGISVPWCPKCGMNNKLKK